MRARGHNFTVVFPWPYFSKMPFCPSPSPSALPSAGTSIYSALQWARPEKLIQAETNLAKMNYSTGAGMRGQGSGKGKISSLRWSIPRGHLELAVIDSVRVRTCESSCYHSSRNSSCGYRHTGTLSSAAQMLASSRGKKAQSSAHAAQPAWQGG